MFVLVFSIFCVISLVNGDCSNPMFKYPIRMFGRTRIPMSLLGTPQPQQNFGICQHLDGLQSCCTATTFQPFIQYFKEYDAQMQLGLQIFKLQTPAQIELLLESWGNLNLNPIQRGYMIQLISLIQPIIDSMSQCNGGLLGYKQGMLCFGCHTDWTDYYDLLHNILYLTKDTCDNINAVCTSMFNQLYASAVPILDAVIGVFNNSANPNPNMVKEIDGYKTMVISTKSICKPFQYKDCQDLLCHGFLHGTVASLNLARPPPPPHAQAHSSDKFAHPAKLFNLKTDPTSPFTAMLAPLEDVFTHALANRKTLQQTSNNSRVYNSYGNGTYNYAAYAYGCECELSFYACPPLPNTGKSEDKGMIIGSSIAAAVGLTFLVLAVLYFVKYRKRGGQTDAHVPLEEEYEAPSNQRQLIEDISNKSLSDPSSTNESPTSAYIAPNIPTEHSHTTSAYIVPNPITTTGSIN